MPRLNGSRMGRGGARFKTRAPGAPGRLQGQGPVIAGGQVRLAATVPNRAELGDLVRNQVHECGRLGVAIEYGVDATASDVERRRPDLAVGILGSKAGDVGQRHRVAGNAESFRGHARSMGGNPPLPIQKIRMPRWGRVTSHWKQPVNHR